MKPPRLNYIYVLFPKPTWGNRSILWAGKVGVSENPKRRRIEIQTDMSNRYGRNIRLWSFIPLPVLFAYKMESAIHQGARTLYGQRRKVMGSGHTEWFRVRNLFTSLLAWLYLSVAIGIENAPYYCAGILFIFIPLDLILCAVLLALAQWGALALVGWLIWSQINF